MPKVLGSLSIDDFLAILTTDAPSTSIFSAKNKQTLINASPLIRLEQPLYSNTRATAPRYVRYVSTEHRMGFGVRGALGLV